MSLRLLCIADDLTGAIESGAKFAQAGISTVVAIGRGAEADVVVVDTESRHLDPIDAAQAVARAVATGAELIYKKTDSTLRGNIGPELRALAELNPKARMAYVPAHPAVGRTVHDGVLYVEGIPVAETAFARDPLNPVRDSRVRSVLECECKIFDGESVADVDSAVDEVLSSGFRIIAGPASVAAALAARISVDRQAPQALPKIDSCQIVNGSLHPASAAQVQYARDQGCLAGGWSEGEDNADAIFVFGGDTAFEWMQSFGCPALWPIGDVVPGVSISRIDRDGAPWLLTKPGGYGTPDLICRVRKVLEGG